MAFSHFKTKMTHIFDCSDSSDEALDFIKNPCKICLNKLKTDNEICDACDNWLNDKFRCRSRVVPCFYCGEFVSYESDKPYQDIACLDCIEKGKIDTCNILAQVEPPSYQVCKNSKQSCFDSNLLKCLSKKVLLCDSCKSEEMSKFMEQDDKLIDKLLDEMLQESQKFTSISNNEEKDEVLFSNVVSNKKKNVYEPLFSLNQVYSSKEHGNIVGVDDGDDFLVVVYKKRKQ